MDTLETIIAGITPLDQGVMEEVQTRLDNLTKPLGSLGALERMAKQYAGAACDPRPAFPKKAVVVLAGDHGVAAEQVSAYPQEATTQMVYNFVRGGAGINALARHAGAKLILADVGVKEEFPADLPILRRKVRRGTDNMRYGPAMTRDEALCALRVGMDIADDLLNQGFQVIGLGEMGIGNTTASAAMVSALTGCAPQEAAGLGTGISDERLTHKIRVIQEAIAVNSPDPNDPVDVLAKVGGLEIAALTGVVLTAAARRALVFLDGFISSAAALAAFRLAPAVQPYLVASHLSAERGHKVVLNALQLKPMLRLNLRLGEGTGAALGMTLLDAGLKVLNEMATFDEAAVAYALQDLAVSEK